MTFYAVDPKDPILQSYEAAFPGMFTPASKIPEALRAHLRYPEDVFSAQMATYGRYHITSPAAFYNAGDAWTISQTAGAGPPSQTLALTQFTNAQGVTIQGPVEKMAPQYQVQSLPGTTNQTFVLSDAFVPISSGNNVQNLSAFMMATSDPSNYGRLTVYVTPSGQNVVGPVQADAEIQQNPTVSKNISLLDQHGSSVLLGNILMVPIDQAMLYIRPLYVKLGEPAAAAQVRHRRLRQPRGHRVLARRHALRRPRQPGRHQLVELVVELVVELDGHPALDAGRQRDGGPGGRPAQAGLAQTTRRPSPPSGPGARPRWAPTRATSTPPRR